MECYEGITMIKTFRGMIPDGGQDTILLHTNDGSTGYRIVKFQTTMEKWGGETTESIMKIYKVPQTTVDAFVDFNDNTLLASNVFSYNTSANVSGDSAVIIFDNEIFNQDIVVTNCTNSGGSGVKVNYYIELEQVKLDLSESTVATLKDIRNTDLSR